MKQKLCRFFGGAYYPHTYDLPWSVIDILSKTPLDKTDIYFLCQRYVQKYFKILRYKSLCQVILHHIGTFSGLVLSKSCVCCQSLWFNIKWTFESKMILLFLAFIIFVAPPHKSLIHEVKGLVKISNIRLSSS